MERAASKCVDWIWKNYPGGQFAVFCGSGNNGGDGLAIARILAAQHKRPVDIYILGDHNSGSEDFKHNYSRLNEFDHNLYLLDEDSHLFSIGDSVVLIDAMFGTGLTRPVDGWRTKVFESVNLHPGDIVSVDIPSGLFSDKLESNPFVAIKAKHTLSFHVPKMSFLFRENQKNVGTFHVLDIGLDRSFHQHQSSPFYYSTRSDIRSILKQKDQFNHKGDHGHLLLASGSIGKMGAAVLAARAALRAGCGLLTVRIPRTGLNVLQTAVPEAMCIPDTSENDLSEIRIDSRYSALAAGPGIGVSPKTTDALGELLSSINIPMVLDADALNILSQNHRWLHSLPKETVLTPHPKEFDRLFGEHHTSFERLQKLQMKAQELGVVIVLKGAYTRVALPDGSIHFNSTGNPGMGTAGSGDVLTGIIGSLLAQGYSTSEAAILGVYIHGLAGDLVAEDHGVEMMVAGDIVEDLPKAFANVGNGKNS
jgi:NAD(P)H-hydrate epimerase